MSPVGSLPGFCRLSGIVLVCFLSLFGCSSTLGPGGETADDDDSAEAHDADGDDDSAADDAPSLPPCEGDDGLEPNDQQADAAALPQDPSAELYICPFDPDWYTFDADAGERLWIRAYFFHDEGNLDLRLLAADGTILTSAASFTNNESMGPYIVPPSFAGPLFLEVTMESASSSGTAYSLEQVE